jgi:hypothetical protein
VKPLFAEDTPTEAHNRRISILLGMSLESVAANEQGRLSASQRSELLAGIQWRLAFLVGSAFLMGILLTLLPENLNKLFGWVTFSVVFVVIGLGLSILGNFSELNYNQVVTYEGIIRRVPQKDMFGRDTGYYHYLLGKQEIQLPGSLKGIVKSGQPYRIFCSLPGKRVIGAQLLVELPTNSNGA